MSPELVILAARLGFVALATFLAIVVWARTRDAAWMLVVVGIVAGYADILHTLLGEFGLAPDRAKGVFPVLALILPNLPWLFFSIAFAVMIRRKR
ncbi:MAG TPA: hypothetical protein PK625_07875 [Spirochaetales bacterium]|nr:hypothetical protein [Spirochaetales bacterium]